MERRRGRRGRPRGVAGGGAERAGGAAGGGGRAACGCRTLRPRGEKTGVRLRFPSRVSRSSRSLLSPGGIEACPPFCCKSWPRASIGRFDDLHAALGASAGRGAEVVTAGEAAAERFTLTCL